MRYLNPGRVVILLLLIDLLLGGEAQAAAGKGQPAISKPASTAPTAKQHPADRWLPPKVAAAPGSRRGQPQVADPSPWHNDYPNNYSIKMVSASDGWIVGQAGMIKHLHNGSWDVYPSPVTTNLYAVDANPATAWAVGGHNTILQRVGSDWLPSTSPLSATSPLIDVDIAGSNVWALGFVISDSEHGRSTLLRNSGSGWSEVSLPLAPMITLYQMAWVSADEGWFTGQEGDFSGSAVIFHYNKGVWQRAALPASVDQYAGGLSIYMLNAEEGWAGMYTDYDPVVLHYAAGVWQTVPATGAAGSDGGCGITIYVNGVVGFTSNDYFQGGGVDMVTCGAGVSGFFKHNATEIGTESIIYAVAGTAADDVWAVGAGGGIFHWDGSRVNTVVPQLSGQKVQMFSSSEGWIKQFIPHGDGIGYTHLFHYSNNTWQPVSLPGSMDYTRLDTFAFANPTDGWVLQDDYGVPISYTHYLSGSWSVNQSVPRNYHFEAMQMLTATDGWAVGRHHDDSTYNPSYPAVTHYNGTTWQEMDIGGGITGTLVDVSFSGPNDGWAVGTRIFHYNGSTWSVVNLLTNNLGMMAVWAVAANDVWVGGRSANFPASSGVMLHWNGSTWQSVPVPIAQVNDIQMLSGNEGWAVGQQDGPEAGAILHYTGSTWQVVSNPGGPLNSVSFTTPTDGWAAGDYNLLHYYPPCLDYYLDVPPNYYAASAILYLSCAGIVGGSGNHIFSPNANSSRAQFAKIITLARGWTIINPTTSTFSDVPTSNVLYRYIETAAANGAVTGYTQVAQCPGTATPCFKPNDQISRGQTAIIVVRAFGWATNTTGGPHFVDVSTSSFFYNAVETAYNRGVINGIDVSHFAPNASVTRGQISKVLYLGLTLP